MELKLSQHVHETIYKLLAAGFGDSFFVPSQEPGTRQSGVSWPNWEHFCPPVSRILGEVISPRPCVTRILYNWC